MERGRERHGGDMGGRDGIRRIIEGAKIDEA